MAKTQYIGVGGVARKVKQPYVGVSGVARKVKSGYVGVSGVARQFFQGGLQASSLAVGDSVYLNVNGTKREFLVIQQGRPSTLYDVSCDGTWLLMKNVYTTIVWDSSYGSSYPNSDLCNYLGNTFIGLLDQNVQSAIKQVKIPYWNGSTYSGSNGASCKIFALSGKEVGGSSSYMPNDGVTLSYFAGTSEYDSKRIAYNLSGNSSIWWLRSIHTDTESSVNAWSVYTSGQLVAPDAATNKYGVRPALILPSTALFNPDTLDFVSA